MLLSIRGIRTYEISEAARHITDIFPSNSVALFQQIYPVPHLDMSYLAGEDFMTNNTDQQACSDGFSVSLIFCGEQVNPDVVTEHLGITPQRTEKVGSENSPGSDHTSKVGIWHYTNFYDTAFDACETLKEWEELFLTKTTELKRLEELGITGYCQLRLLDPNEDSLYLEPSFLKAVSLAGVGLSIWWTRDNQATKSNEAPISEYQLAIPEPSYFFSRGDEKHFFEALYAIASINKVQRENKDLTLHLTAPILDEQSLRELVSIMMRYNLDMTTLRSQANADSNHWLVDKNAYWYESIFGKTDKEF